MTLIDKAETPDSIARTMRPSNTLHHGHRAARYSGGLSVFNFLRIRTWMSSGPGEPRGEFLEDVAWMARQEGLEAHARAAEARR